MQFSDLAFRSYPVGDGKRAIVNFPNGYGASVVCSQYSYGGDEGLYELAVLHHGSLCYMTPVTDDVEGWLTPERVTELLQQIEALAPSDESGS